MYLACMLNNVKIGLLEMQVAVCFASKGFSFAIYLV